MLKEGSEGGVKLLVEKDRSVYIRLTSTISIAALRAARKNVASFFSRALNLGLKIEAG